MKRHSAAVAAVVLMGLVVLFGASDGERGRVEVAQLSETNWNDFAPAGKESDAIYGDVVLRNRYLTAVIAQPLDTRDANMTIKDVGGALIDLTLRETANDQLGAFYPGRRKDSFDGWTIAVDDQSPKEPGKSDTLTGSEGRVNVRAAATKDRPACEVTYSLDADARWLTVTTKYTNTADKPLSVVLEDDLRADGRNEDMAKLPNGTADLFWCYDRYWGQAYAVDAPGRAVQSDSDTRTTVLKYPAEREVTATVAPGASFEWTRRIIPGRSLLDAKAIAGERHGRKTSPVRLTLVDGSGRPLPRALVEISQSGEPYGWAVSDEQGEVATALPAGTWQVTIAALGVPVVTNAHPLTLDVHQSTTPQSFPLDLKDFRPGMVKARITDAQGQPIPCKVQFIPKEGTPRPEFGPDTAAFGVGNLYYAPLGTFEQAIPSGRYEVIISHGPEYDAIFTDLTVPPGETAPLTAKLVRSVETDGWVSGDFHGHSSPSGDNTSSQTGRVLNLVCENIEFAPCTEHNRIDSYAPVIESLRIAPFLATTTGIELTGTPLPLNHQNAFPLRHKPHTQNGGGPVPDADPEKQIERLALWDDHSDKLVQQNHPDIGWLFYDRNGDGQPDGGHERGIVHIDVMEIHPIDAVLHLGPFLQRDGKPAGNNRVFNWLQLLNQGYRIPAVVNTDAHYNYHGSGGLRNWIQSSTDDPAKIDPMEIAHAAEQGRVIVSNGPFLEITLHETGKTKTVTAGQDLAAPSGRVTTRVRVQCPDWLDVDHVFLLVNGRVAAAHDATREKNPDRFRSGPVKFDQTMELELKSDAHIIAVAGGAHSTVGAVMGPSWGKQHPAALSNPIYVDVDGNGFQPNKDTLDAPLPVKFGAAKK